jgi:hypothetical protein
MRFPIVFLVMNTSKSLPAVKSFRGGYPPSLTKIFKNILASPRISRNLTHAN